LPRKYLRALYQNNSTHEDPSDLAGKGQRNRPRIGKAWLAVQLQSRACQVGFPDLPMATGTQLEKQLPHKINGFGDHFASAN
jgi:hypothetical protein